MEPPPRIAFIMRVSGSAVQGADYVFVLGERMLQYQLLWQRHSLRLRVGVHLLRTEHTALNIMGHLLGAFRGLLVDSEFLVTLLFLAGTAQSGGEMEMRGWVLGLKTHGVFERRDGLLRLSGCNQRTAQTDERIREPGVELGGFTEVLDRVRPLLLLPGHFAKHVFRARISGVDRELGFEFLLRVGEGGGGLGFRENQSPDAVVNAGQSWILFEHEPVFGHSVVPAALRFQ